MKNLYPFLQRSGEFYEIKQIFFFNQKNKPQFENKKSNIEASTKSKK